MEMILDPTIMFFCLGVLAVWVRSNIEIPPQTIKFLSYYLLMSIGFKGGISLAKTTLNLEIIETLVAGVFFASLIPFWIFFVLRLKISVENAAAAAACYGSVSAVTFLTANSWLENQGVRVGGHMVAMMALVEAPAIMMGLALPKIMNRKKLKVSESDQSLSQFNLKEILHDAFFNGSVFILVGSMIIGYIMNPKLANDYQVFVYDIFKGFLCFFLFDLGMVAARQVKELKNSALFLSAVAILAPVVNASIALLIAQLIGMSPTDGFMFMIITASASYIAVPAALKTSLPEASSSIYLTMSLGITFPFNILVGMPIYWKMAQTYLS